MVMAGRRLRTATRGSARRTAPGAIDVSFKLFRVRYISIISLNIMIYVACTRDLIEVSMY
jgi:hypothetical protein